VANSDSKLGHLGIRGAGGPQCGRECCRLQLSLLTLLVCLLAPGFAAAAGKDVQSRPVAPIGSGASIAIADFDGDQLLDFASVQADRLGTSSTNYWIELRLTGSGEQAIQLVAPPGGLQIEARDVNGDNAVDLVLSTAWFRKPVAVFLNDGHGRFSRAEPTDFPGAFSDSTGSWNSSFNRASDAAGIPPPSRSGICSGAGQLPEFRGPSEPIRASSSGFLFDALLIAYASRAPPARNSLPLTDARRIDA